MKQTVKPYHVHFVCRGNTFRSRLAAAYFATLAGPQFIISSSGIEAGASTVKTSERYTKILAKRHKLSFEINTPHAQTTDELLANADVVVFMNKTIYDQARTMFHLDDRKVLVWHVSDIDPEVKLVSLASGSEQVMFDAVEPIYSRVVSHCNELYKYLTHTAWVDVVTKDNHATGLRLPAAWVSDRGLWHRGVHVVAQTVDGKYVVGKRSKSIVFAPGMLEISLGGSVDTGEHPLTAARRETQEELGIRLHGEHFAPLFMYRQYGYHPHYKKQVRCHLYVYTVRLPLHSTDLHPQKTEVADVRLITKSQIKRLLRKHRLAHFGRLKTGYKLYQQAVALSTLPY